MDPASRHASRTDRSCAKLSSRPLNTPKCRCGVPLQPVLPDHPTVVPTVMVSPCSHADARQVAVDRDVFGAVRSAMSQLHVDRLHRAAQRRAVERRFQAGVHHEPIGDGERAACLPASASRSRCGHSHWTDPPLASRTSTAGSCCRLRTEGACRGRRGCRWESRRETAC